ncbi:hypothetical protein EZS27_020373 [termite gut metagenome]|jgi:hypothetical protein|uniref:Uncharacterized protein n=1 Tax=termite gut metagenome TaxID=433724 RepID=A0A5J4RDX4_9ZZZZ
MEKITMGNDELILYIRKQHPNCSHNTAYLGREIWEWIRDNANGKKTEENMPCLWGNNANNVGANDLPATATQFEFDRNKLSDLYDKLDSL